MSKNKSGQLVCQHLENISSDLSENSLKVVWTKQKVNSIL